MLFELGEIQTRRDSLHAKRADLEKQIAENKTYLERAERNLKHAQNQKEYETAMRETDALQKQIAAFETQIVEAMEEIEGVDKELEDRREEIDTLDAKRDEALAEFDTAVGAERKEFEAESAHRATAFSALSEKLAVVYDRLSQRSRDGLAVSEVINGSCTACNMSLRPQVQMEVRRGDQIITCENCSRILYIRKQSSEASA